MVESKTGAANEARTRVNAFIFTFCIDNHKPAEFTVTESVEFIPLSIQDHPEHFEISPLMFHVDIRQL